MKSLFRLFALSVVLTSIFTLSKPAPAHACRLGGVEGGYCTIYCWNENSQSYTEHQVSGGQCWRSYACPDMTLSECVFWTSCMGDSMYC